MTLLGIDVGTTHCKAGLFDGDGRTIHIASREMRTLHAPEGYAYFDPELVWQMVTEVVQEAVSKQHDSVQAVGVASMAESGLLIERDSGLARSPIVPWFDTSAQGQATRIEAESDPVAFYRRSGLRVSYKCSLAKILWLREQQPPITDGAIWLSVADYVAYRLTGAFGTDYSLAGRTGLFDIGHMAWDEAWLAQWNIPAEMLPPPRTSGEPLGHVSAELTDIDIPQGVPVCVCGHDHLCGAVGSGAMASGEVFDSMGTAEVLTGGFPRRELTQTDFDTGLLSGCHVAAGRYYWLGSLSTSGGAVEWLRGILGEPPLSYKELVELVERCDPGPTGILFFPYLSGRGAPHSDPCARAAWVGLRREHSRAEMAKAVLEGTAFEMEVIRQAGEAFTGEPIIQLTAAGGGTRNRRWLQIKADVCGCPIRVPDEVETTLLGAAVVAGVGGGVYTSETEAQGILKQRDSTMIEPDVRRHGAYRSLFEDYVGLQGPPGRFHVTN